MDRHLPRAAPLYLPPRAAYQRWAPTYGSSGRNLLSDTAEYLFGHLQPNVSGQRVLDVACGDGRYARLAARAGAKEVVAVDFAPAMLAAARAANARLVVAGADMRSLPFAAAKFDAVYHVLALSHVPDLAVAIHEIGRVLAPGGAMVLVDLHPTTKERDWRRTFRDGDGRLCEVSWHAHGLDQVREAVVAASLRTVRFHEVPLLLPPQALGRRCRTSSPAVYGLLARRIA